MTDRLLSELSIVSDEHADLAGRAYLRIKAMSIALARSAPAARPCPACGQANDHPWWTVGDDSYGCADSTTRGDLDAAREALRLLERGKPLEARDLLRRTLGHEPSLDATRSLSSDHTEAKDATGGQDERVVARSLHRRNG